MGEAQGVAGLREGEERRLIVQRQLKLEDDIFFFFL